jgi:DNA-binding NarL/FixJ family response regulator
MFKPFKNEIVVVTNKTLVFYGLKSMLQKHPDFQLNIMIPNGLSLIAYLQRSTPPDLILMELNDYEQPVFETLSWVRTNLPKIRFVVLAGENVTEKIKSTAIRLGARSIIPMDTSEEHLVEVLSHVSMEGYFVTPYLASLVINALNEKEPEPYETRKFENPLMGISEKQIQFLTLCCSDKTYKEIAAEMNISVRTADSYRDQLFARLGIRNRATLVMKAIQFGIIRLF